MRRALTLFFCLTSSVAASLWADTDTYTFTPSATETLIPTPVPCTSLDLGYHVSDSGSDHLENFVLYQPATLAGMGTVYNVYVYTGGVAGQVKVGIYADNGSGRPGALVTEGPPVNVVNGGWTLAPVAGVSLSPGLYFLAVEGTSTAYLHFNNSFGSAQYGYASFGNLPATAGSTYDLAWNFDVYAALECPGTTPTVTSTVTVTPSVTATPSATPTATPTVTKTATITLTATRTPTATITETPGPNCTAYGNAVLGNQASFTIDDNYLAQSFTVGTLQRLHALRLYNAGNPGRLSMGLYKDNGSGQPGQIVAKGLTASAVTGWVDLTMPPVDIDTGAYWIVALARKNYNGGNSVFPAYVTTTSGANFSGAGGKAQWPDIIPDTLPVTGPFPNRYYSMYALLCDDFGAGTSTPTITPTPDSCSIVGNYSTTGTFLASQSARAMHATYITVTAGSIVSTMHVYFDVNSAQTFIAAIYTDNSYAPGTLVIQSATQTAVDRWNTVNFPITYLAPGNYWLAAWSGAEFVYNAANSQVAAHATGPVSGPLAADWNVYTPAGGGALNLLIFADLCPSAYISPTFTFTQTPTVTPTLTRTPTPTASPSITQTPLPAGCNILGTTGLGGSSTNYADNIVSMPITLGQDAYLYNFQIHTTTFSGNGLKVALYNDNGGSPGTVFLQSGPQAAIQGLNIINVTPTLVPAGVYWIAVLAQGGPTAPYYDYLTTGSGSVHKFSQAYASGFVSNPVGSISSFFPRFSIQLCDLPTTYTPTSTMSPTPSVTPAGPSCPSGSVMGPIYPTGSAAGASGFLYFHLLSAGQTGQISGVSVYVTSGSGNTARAAIYANGASVPSTLLNQGPIVNLVDGWNNLPFYSAQAVSSGTLYWIAANLSGGSAQVYYPPSGSANVKRQSFGIASTLASNPGSLTNIGTVISLNASICPAGTYTETAIVSTTATPSPTMSPGPECPGGAIAGVSALQGSNANSFSIYEFYQPFVAPMTGQCSLVNVYVTGGGGGNATVALYSNGAGVPGTKLLETNQLLVSGWNVFNFVNTTPITNGATYWIAVHACNSATTFNYAASGGSSRYTNNFSDCALNGSAPFALNYIFPFNAYICPAGTVTETRVVSNTNTVTLSVTLTPTSSPSSTRTSTSTPTPTSSLTATPSSSSTRTVTLTSTNTLTWTYTQTWTITKTFTTVETPTLTATPVEGSALLDGALTDGNVYAMDSDGTRLYLGGAFYNIGQRCLDLGLLDVNTKVATRGPAVTYPGSTASIQRFLPDGQGGYYASGNFTNIGGVARNGLAHINANGTVDQNFNAGFASSSAGEMALAGDRLIVIGPVAPYLMALNRSTGAALPGQLLTSITGGISTVFVRGSTLYFGGSFTAINGLSRSRLAALDLNSLTLLPFDGGADNTVTCLENDGGPLLFVGGQFTNLSGSARSLLGALDLSTGALSSWDPGSIPTGGGNQIYDLQVDGATLYVGGKFTSINGSARSSLAGLSTATAAVLATPNVSMSGGLQYVYTLAVRNNKLYIGGWWDTLGGFESPALGGIDLSDNSVISALPHLPRSTNNNHMVNNIAFISPTQMAVGGDFKAFGAKARLNLGAVDIATGQVSNFSADAGSGPFYPVRALSVSPSANILWVGGEFLTLSNAAKTYLGAVNATTGTLLSGYPASAPNGAVLAMAMGQGTDHSVYVGGSFTAMAGHGYLAALNASGAVMPWAANVPNAVYAIAHDPVVNKVYVGGFFATLNTVSRIRFGALNDSTDPSATLQAYPYAPLVAGVTSVNALCLQGRRLYMGGLFNTVSGVARVNFAELDLSAGAPLTTMTANTDGIIRGIGYNGGNIYLGGVFTTLSGGARTNIGVMDAAGGGLRGVSVTSGGSGPEVNAIYAQPGYVAVGGKFTDFDASRFAYSVSLRPLPSVTFAGTSTNTSTPTSTPTATPSKTPTSTATPTITKTSTATPSSTSTSTNTPTYTETPVDSFTSTETLLPTDSPTVTETPTVTESYTESETSTESPTSTETGSFTETPSTTPTFTETPTGTESPSSTETPSSTATKTVTLTATESFTSTESPSSTSTRTPTPTKTSTLTATESFTSTATPSFTATASATPTRTVTATVTETGSNTATPTHSPTASATPTGTESPVFTGTSTSTATPTYSETKTSTSTRTLTATPTLTSTPTSTATPSPTLSSTSSASPTATSTVTSTSSSTVTPSVTMSSTATQTVTATPSATRSSTGSTTFTPTSTQTPTFSATRTATSTATSSSTATETLTSTSTRTSTASLTPSFSATVTPTFTVTLTASASLTASSTPTGSFTASVTATRTNSATFTRSATESATPSASPTVTQTPTASPSSTVTVTPNLTQTSIVLSQTPTFTMTPVPFLGAPAAGPPVVVGPVPCKKGGSICIGVKEPVASTSWVVYNFNGYVVATLSFGGESSQCFMTSNLAPGIYAIAITTKFANGGSDYVRQKVVILP